MKWLRAPLTAGWWVEANEKAPLLIRIERSWKGSIRSWKLRHQKIADVLSACFMVDNNWMFQKRGAAKQGLRDTAIKLPWLQDLSSNVAPDCFTDRSDSNRKQTAVLQRKNSKELSDTSGCVLLLTWSQEGRKGQQWGSKDELPVWTAAGFPRIWPSQHNLRDVETFLVCKKRTFTMRKYPLHIKYTECQIHL